jgi:hypothetical protein
VDRRICGALSATSHAEGFADRLRPVVRRESARHCEVAITLRDVVLSLRRRLVVPLMAGIFVLSACGGGDNDDAGGGGDGGQSQVASEPADRDSDTPAGQPTITPEDDSAPDPADQAIAEAALLTLQDFPVGWEAAPGEKDDDDRAGRESIAECVGVEYDQLYDDANTEADSPTFTSENDSEVDHSVSLAGDEADMTEAFEIASTPEFRECAAESVREAVAKSSEDSGDDVSVGQISLNELSVGSFGDQTVAYRVTIPIEAEGFSLEAKLEVAIVRVGRAQSNITATSFGSGISTEELAEFVQTATQRLQKALAEG